MTKYKKRKLQFQTQFLAVLIGAALIVSVAYSISLFRSVPLHDNIVSPTPTVTPGFPSESDIISNFTAAKFRVIKVALVPSLHVYLITVTERSIENTCGEGNQRCNDDAACGSIYTSPHCYFFTEPDFYAGVDGRTKFLGKLNPGSGVFETDTKLTFPDDTHVEFTTSDADVSSFTKTWRLDLVNGGITKLNEKDYYPQIPSK